MVKKNIENNKVSGKLLTKKYIYNSPNKKDLQRKKPAIFFDRDGVLIKDCHYLSCPSKVKLEIGVKEIIRYAKSQNWIIIVITNQSGISRGFFTWDDYDKVTKKFLNILGLPNQIDAIYANGYSLDKDSYWRKPNPGMIFEAMKEFNIDLEKSILIGDRLSDLQCASRAGLNILFHVMTGHGLRERELIIKKTLKNGNSFYKNRNHLIFKEEDKCSKLFLLENLIEFPHDFIHKT